MAGCLLAVLGVVAGCGGEGRAVIATFFPTTPYEAYEYSLREIGLERTALGYEWITAGRDALVEALPVQTPYEEIGYLDPLGAGAMGFLVSAERGQVLMVEVELEGETPNRVFLDLFRTMPDTLRPHRHELSADSTARNLEFFVRRDGDYVVRVQPELLRGGRYRIRIISGASLAFPVAGRDVGAIRSTFGASRDGGRREHHGVDIFAPRGTPVLAASDGQIRSTRIGGLGGKVVWLRDQFGQSQYYAHLDSQAVRPRQVVSAGDTLGFVGNTGNARTTPPHLHFGIYSRGPYDPYPSLEQLSSNPAPLEVDFTNVGGWVRTSVGGVTMYSAPSSRASAVTQMTQHTPVHVLGGTGRWYRVELPDGAMGFVVARLFESTNNPLRSAELVGGGLLFDRPTEGGSVMDSVGPGTAVAVLGSFGDYLYVQSSSGPRGWLALD